MKIEITETINDVVQVQETELIIEISDFDMAGGAVLKSTITGKGSLIVGTASGTVAELAAGADGTVLMSDSSAAGGLSWGIAEASMLTGWISVADVWVYASASTVTVPSGAASTYMMGQKVKFTQTTVKYFIISGVTDTVLTLTSPFGSVVADAAISSVYTSNGIAPAGFNVGFTQNRYSTTQLDKASSTVLANVPGLEVQVASGGVYRFRAILYTTAHASGGAKTAISGTATATSILYRAFQTGVGLTSSPILVTIGTALDAAGGYTGTLSTIEIFGTIIVNAGGTLTVQFAQNASYATASSVYVGSTFEVTRIA